MSNYVDNIWFHTMICCECGMAFAMTAEFKECRLEDKKWFYCPAGHSQHFTGETKAQKLQKELDRKEQALQQEREKSVRVAHQRDQINKTYNRMRERVKNGVCPCCNRTFQNLMNHIKTKHPDFANHDTLRTIRGIYGMTQSALSREIGVSPSYISQYEANKYVPPRAKADIEQWLATQEGVEK